jgi:AraC-like DNA-binding protein
MPSPRDAHLYVPPPGHPLHPYVQAIFRTRWNGAGMRETILPKGNVDYLFNLGAPMRGVVPGLCDHVLDEGCTWAGGLRTRPYIVRPQGQVDLLGVVLRAETCAGLMPLPPAELLNAEMHGPDLPDDVRIVGERVRETAGFGGQCELIIQWLMKRLRPLRGGPMARHACAVLRGARGEDPVGTTARAVGISPRHLRRMITDHVGVGPAEYVRVARFVRATQLIADPALTLGQVAHGAGYFDQAHLCRDFRVFGGMSPREYRGAATSPVVGHIWSDDGRSVQDAHP